MARKKLPDADRRSKIVAVSLTPAQYNAVAKLASGAGMSSSAFVRAAIEHALKKKAA